jgi:hypothetical protein
VQIRDPPSFAGYCDTQNSSVIFEPSTMVRLPTILRSRETCFSVLSQQQVPRLRSVIR